MIHPQDSTSGKTSHNDKALHVLLVDVASDLTPAIRRAGKSQALKITRCKTLKRALKHIESHKIDLAIIHEQLSDGSGLTLANALKQNRHATQTMMVSDAPSVDSAIDAIHAGVNEFIDLSAEVDNDLEELEQRIVKMIQAHGYDQRRADRVHRLRRICRKLNDARAEVSQQVDVLCSDLVAAYQELAMQVHETMHSKEYGAMIKDELDFEVVLRRTLEYLVEKVGSSNAAIFMPTSMDEYSLGGYVNYDCGSEGADMLLQHLADVLAPKVASDDELVHITDNNTLQHWLGEDAAWLADSHLVGMPCMDGDEVLAVIVMFRDASRPFNNDAAEALIAVSNTLAQALAKVIRVHHRCAPPDIHGNWEDDIQDDIFPF